MIKMTFTLDDDTAQRLREIAARLDRPQSYVVREAIREYGSRGDKMSEEETRRILEVFDTYVPAIPPRPRKEVEAELAEIRAARRQWGRRRPGRKR